MTCRRRGQSARSSRKSAATEEPSEQTSLPETYGDLLPLVGLQDPDPRPFLVPQAFQAELRPGFLQLAVAHVKDGEVVGLPHRHATVAGNGVVSAAAVPLAGVDLERPGQAPVKDKGSGLVVFITSKRCRSTSRSS